MKFLLLLVPFMLGCSASIQWQFGEPASIVKRSKPRCNTTWEPAQAPKNPPRNPHRLFDVEN